MKLIPATCKCCKRPREVEFDPAGIFSEKFVQNAFVCDRCRANYEAKKSAAKGTK